MTTISSSRSPCSQAWIAYIAGDMLEVSGVIATVTCGMVLGWHQHEVFSAAVRTRGTAFWQVIVFVFEALVFVLIGLSLRSVVMRLGGADNALAVLGAGGGRGGGRGRAVALRRGRLAPSRSSPRSVA